MSNVFIGVDSLADAMERLTPFEFDPDTGWESCIACGDPLLPREFVTYFPLGPGSDPEEQELAARGKPFLSAAAIIHWPCATGMVQLHD